MKRKVLSLYTGNSSRSQMAEAIVNANLWDTWEAFCAGTKPAGYVHPKAIAVLAEIGIHHTGRSKPAYEFRGMDFDLVVTVCDSAAEDCPTWLGKGKKSHHSFSDPVKVMGTEEEMMAAFRAVRDDMMVNIPTILNEWPGLNA